MLGWSGPNVASSIASARSSSGRASAASPRSLQHHGQIAQTTLPRSGGPGRKSPRRSPVPAPTTVAPPPHPPYPAAPAARFLERSGHIRMVRAARSPRRSPTPAPATAAPPPHPPDPAAPPPDCSARWRRPDGPDPKSPRRSPAPAPATAAPPPHPRDPASTVARTFSWMATSGWPGPNDRLADRQRPLHQRPRPRRIPQILQHRCQIAQLDGHARIVRGEGCLDDR